MVENQICDLIDGRAQTPGGYQDGIPSAIARGGNAGATFNSGDGAGAYSIDAQYSPQMRGEFTGFRSAR
ncbi:MAG: hypothetical protein ACC707_17860 [Thiohalomonadales bacterium]